MRLFRFAASLVFVFMIAVVPAFAVNPDEMLKDPALEARARALSAELRCMVCQNQSIDDSNADLARDIRLLVRERLEKGDSDQQVIDYLVSRYGDFILLKPPLTADTVILWFAPAALFAAGAFALFLRTRKRQQTASNEMLSPEEELQLKQVLKE
ncbi:cytochrome c-type biogenesis protein CcmH [Allorhizobium sp. BGMRC 0089]|uniref:cytochrome c-type biogenesis protein n=1 Tax=Allorhizobium sonneratiae TaxID=2934936 RepID=UPI0020337DD3|nr:cytochrome c-type biogenesis protein [Allorhizobium sonneratiae]MCM2291918.1 cytochrome c-type biogenesis protein CcmH [Allorhizobium sonneratiae]